MDEDSFNDSSLRSLMEGANYQAFHSLTEARQYGDAVAIFEGDYGGTIYLVVPVRQINCDEAVLHTLLADLDALVWADPEGASICLERRPANSRIAGGMGGGVASNGLWLHPEFEQHNIIMAVEQVLSGVTLSIRQ